MRVKCVELGMKMAISLCPLKGNEIDKYVIPNSYEFAWKIGQIIYNAKQKNINPLLQLQKCKDDKLISNSKIVYYGKIINLKRENDGGFNKGSVKLQKIITYIFIPITNFIFLLFLRLFDGGICAVF